MPINVYKDLLDTHIHMRINRIGETCFAKKKIKINYFKMITFIWWCIYFLRKREIQNK